MIHLLVICGFNIQNGIKDPAESLAKAGSGVLSRSMVRIKQIAGGVQFRQNCTRRANYFLQRKINILYNLIAAEKTDL